MQGWARLSDTDLGEQHGSTPDPFDFTGGGRRATQPRPTAPADPFDFTSASVPRPGLATQRAAAPVRRRAGRDQGRTWWIVLSVVLLAGHLGIWAYYQPQIDREDKASCEVGYASVGASAASDRLGISGTRESLDEAQAAFGRSLIARMEYDKLIEHGFAATRRNRALGLWTGIWCVVAVTYFLTAVNKTKNRKPKRN